MISQPATNQIRVNQGVQIKSNSRIFAKWLGRFMLGMCLWTAAGLPPDAVYSQDDQTLEETRGLLRELADQAKQLKTASDYSEFISKCQPILEHELTTAQRNYVLNVAAWARGKRGEMRLETAQQLQQVGNAQFQQVLESALEDFHQAIAADSNRWKLFQLRGITLVHQNQLAEAIEDFDRAIELRPEETSGWYNRGLAYLLQDRWEQAVLNFDTALNLAPNDWEIVTGRGQAYLGWQQFENSYADLHRVVQQLPNNPAARVNLADALLGLRRWPEAVEQLQHATGDSQQHDAVAIAWQRLAWLQATCPDPQVRNLTAASQAIQQAITLAGETRGNLETLAVVQTVQGDADAAQQTASRAIKITGRSMIGLIQTAGLDQELLQQSPIQLMQHAEPVNEKSSSTPTPSEIQQAGSDR